MKKSILFFSLLFLFSNPSAVFGTCGSPVFSGTLPAAPAAGQTVSVINEATFCSGGCERANFNVSWNSAFDVTIETLHCPGMLAYICTSTDTTSLGNLGAGTYTVHYLVYESSDCQSFTNTDSLTFTFTVSGCPAPEANFSFLSDELDVTFTDSSTSGGGTSWFWTFGDGDSSALQNPFHNYFSPGYYEVCLVVTDSCGADTLCDTVEVFMSGNSPFQNGSIFQIFPNPAQEAFVVSGKLSAMGSLTLVNKLGVELLTRNVRGNFSETIDVNDLPVGVYFLTLESVVGVDFFRVVVVK